MSLLQEHKKGEQMSGKWDKYSEYYITHPKTNKQKQRQNKTKSTSENVRSKDIMVDVYVWICDFGLLEIKL